MYVWVENEQTMMVPSWMKCMFTLMTHVVFSFHNEFYIELLSLFPFSLRLLRFLVRRSDIKSKLNSRKNITLCFIWLRIGSWDNMSFSLLVCVEFS
jgi:hypothetical protein